MRPRYLIAAGDGRSDWSELALRLDQQAELRLALACPRWAVFANERCRCMALGEGGAVVGTLFHRHGAARPLDRLDQADSDAIVAGGSDRLLRAFWGGYVTLLAGQDEIRISRDPSAALPCYFTLARRHGFFASDAELLVESGLVKVDLDWEALGQHFFSAGVPTPVTAVRGVWELMPGFVVSVPGQPANQRPTWSPWDHVQPVSRNDPADRAEQLARTVEHCVRGWTAAEGQLLVSVSGGLDSSIVSACLAKAGANATCLTMYGDDPAGDERMFARALCSHLGLPLLERPYRLDEVDISEPLGTHLPRPQDRTQAIAYERAHLRAAQEIGAAAFVTGNGGDSVFGYSQSAAAVADRYLSNGCGRGVLRTLRDICRQTGCGPVEAAAAAIRIARGPRSYRCRPAPLFLHPDLLATLTDATFDHPWLSAPADALPGKAAHIASILRVLQCLEPSRSRYLPALNPLVSQPIIEMCLAVPTWEWRAGGRDRSLARQAFADDLPALITRRRVKGGPDGFAAQILDRFRSQIRDRLLHGHLARQRIIDTKALETVLGDQRPTLGEQRVRILEFVAAEAWLDSWLSRAGIGSASP